MTIKLINHIKYRKSQLNRLFKKLKSHYFVWANTKHLHGPKTIQRSKFSCIVLSVIRDSQDYIEPFIQYYLSLGVKHIILMDNGSKDETIARASQYEKVTILQCHLPFGKYKIDMRQFLIDHYSFNHWCLLVDCDEFFDYPYSNKLTLSGLIQWLDAHQYNAVATYMLDMFSKNEIQAQSHEINTNFRQLYRWFEINSIEKKPLPSELSNQIPAHFNLELYYNGVRHRVFNSSPFLTKFSLLKPNFRLRLVGSHLIQWAKIADITCVVFHYKFLPNFSELVNKAVQEKQYYNDSSEYKRYQEILNNNAALTLYSEQSIEYENIDQLIELGFLNISQDYIKYQNSLTSNTKPTN